VAVLAGTTGTTGATGTSAVSPAGYGKTVSSAHASHRQRVNHSNTGATHSPEVLRQLAGKPAGPKGSDPPQNGAAKSTGLKRSTPPKTADLRGVALGTASPAALQGVDVASYQHPGGQSINWRGVARAGIQFAAVKTTEGTYYRNPFALTDLAQAKAAGLSVMAYAFAIPNGNGGRTSPVAQADYLVSDLASAGGPLPPIMLDIEYNPYGAECYGLTQSAMVTWIARFSGEIQAKTGAEPIIYGPGPWWHDCTGGTSRFAQYPLWVPDYTSAPSPAVTPGWSNYGFWQYSSAGTVNGINAPGNTDLDQLNPAAIPLLNPGSRVGATGGTVNVQLQRADPVAGQTPSFSAAGLPPGTTISATGQVTGWPVQAGNYQPVVTATDSKGQSGSVSFAWTVNAGTTTGPAGPVQLDLGGQCLAAAGTGKANGTEAQIMPCTSSSAQTWTYAPDGTLRNGSSCLTIPAAAQGAQAGLQPCASTPAQQWHLAYPRGLNPALGHHPTTLVNPWSGMCLADPGFSRTAKTQVALWPCDGYANESWTLPAGPVTSQIPGLCVADTGNQTANNSKIAIWKCDGTPAQAWLAEPDGTLRVNGKCLDVASGATASGSPVDLYNCNGTQAQQWNLVPDGAGVTLLNPGTGLCLADPGDATSDGKQLVIANCAAGDPGMSWRVS
jgi:GH25 family lysozyme M1 (1,4-beta-N-acetylmuramidase)